MLLDGKFVYSAEELKDIAETQRKANREERIIRAKEWVKGAIKQYCLPTAKIGETDVTFVLPETMYDCVDEVREIFEILHYAVYQKKERYVFQVFWNN